MKFLQRFNKKISNAIILIKVMAFIIVEIGIIICFMSIDMPLYIGILFSNVFTFIIALYASKTFKLFGKIVSGDADDVENRVKKLQDKVDVLEENNRKLRNQHDIDIQTLAHFKKIDFTTKLILSESLNIGYVVTEETISDISKDPSLSIHIPEVSLLERGVNTISSLLNISRSPMSILFIDKFYHKNTIGIDLGKIRFATNHFGEILLYGVQLEILHDASADLDKNRSASDVKHCWIISKANNGTCDIKNDDKYNKLKNAYMQQQIRSVKQSYETSANELCKQMTAGLHKSLQSRYEKLRFIELGSNEYNNFEWHPLMDACGSTKVMNILIDLYSGIKLLKDSNDI